MPRIVIVGCGPAGLGVVQALVKELTPQDDTEIVILEKSKFYYNAIGTPRAVVDADFAKKLFVPFDNVIPSSAKSFAKFQRAVVTRIVATASEVEYEAIGEDGEALGDVVIISYDYLVIATGSTYTVPFKQPENDFKRSTTESKIAEVREQVQRANKVLVVGGGAVGVEVAGEIKARYPEKSVTILEGKDKLVAGEHVREKFRTRLSKFVDRLGVKVILGERLETRLEGNGFETRTLRTNKGTVIESDIQLLCGGFSPTTELVRELDASLVTAKGFIRVNDKLQLDSARYSNIYALGDASNSKASKHALSAGQQGSHLGNELVLVARKMQTNVAKEFPVPEDHPTMIPLGPNGGVSQLPVFGGVVLGNFITRTFKSKEYFATLVWKSLGATVPN